jgi:8-amino-7-oxononanoate synthase
MPRMYGSVSSAFDPLARLAAATAEREAAGLRRRLVPRPPPGQRPAAGVALDLASNDYLGLAGDPRLAVAAAVAAATWGTGATGSRLVTGTTALHAELEDELGAFCGAPGALVFSSGYLANLAAVTALAAALDDGGGVLLVSDAGNHASLIDACRLARGSGTRGSGTRGSGTRGSGTRGSGTRNGGVRFQVTPHRDTRAVEAALATRREQAAVVISDAVFSVDGGLAPVAELHAIARRHQALLLLDEAHSFGVLGDGGRGTAHAAGIAAAPDVIRTVTLSKALAGQGGAVLAAPEIIATLIDTGRGFIFDTGLAPPSAGAALAALRLLRGDPGLPGRARAATARLAAVARAAGLPVSEPTAAVVCVRIGDPGDALAAQRICAAAGVLVGCFRPPSVPDGQACLRLTGRASLSEIDLGLASRVLAEVREHCHHGRNTANAGRYHS